MKAIPIMVVFCLTFACAARAQTGQFSSVRASLEYWEGVRYVPYMDPVRADKVVGIGHNLSAHKNRIKRSYTPAEVTQFYLSDMQIALRTARRYVVRFDDLPEGVKQTVLNVVWTTGDKGYSKFVRFNTALSKRQYTLAATSLSRSLWARQVAPARASWAVSVLRNVR